MAKKIGSGRQLGPHYLKAWRNFRGMSQEAAAEKIGATAASLSRIEGGTQPYSQEVLESLAELYLCSPTDLLAVDPNEDSQGDYIDAYRLAVPERRDIARDILSAGRRKLR